MTRIQIEELSQAVDVLRAIHAEMGAGIRALDQTWLHVARTRLEFALIRIEDILADAQERQRRRA